MISRGCPVASSTASGHAPPSGPRRRPRRHPPWMSARTKATSPSAEGDVPSRPLWPRPQLRPPATHTHSLDGIIGGAFPPRPSTLTHSEAKTPPRPSRGLLLLRRHPLPLPRRGHIRDNITHAPPTRPRGLVHGDDVAAVPWTCLRRRHPRSPSPRYGLVGSDVPCALSSAATADCRPASAQGRSAHPPKRTLVHGGGVPAASPWGRVRRRPQQQPRATVAPRPRVKG